MGVTLRQSARLPLIMQCFGFALLFNTFLPSSFLPQTPYFDFQSFPVQPVTHYHKPAPLYHKPSPAYHKPAPVYHKPAHSYHKPKPAPLYKSAGPPYHHTPAYVPHVYAKHPTTYRKPAPLSGFVNLGPFYTATEAPAEEEATVEVIDDVADVVDLKESDKSSGSGKPEKLVLETEETNSENMAMTKEELIEIAVERIKEMEELKEDGLVVLEPQSTGDIVSVDNMAALDGMNIVEFESLRVRMILFIRLP